jgi:hypothetical protein
MMMERVSERIIFFILVSFLGWRNLKNIRSGVGMSIALIKRCV